MTFHLPIPHRTFVIALAALGVLLTAGSESRAKAPPSQEPASTQTETAAAAEQAPREAVQAALATPTLGSLIFIDPETGELTSEPAPGQVQRLLDIGRAQAAARAATAATTTAVGQPTQAEIANHTSAIFPTSIGVGAALDDRFLHALKVKVSATGELVYTCDQHGDHDPSAEQPQP